MNQSPRTIDFKKLAYQRFMPKVSNQRMYLVHYDAGVRTYTVFIAKCQSYDGWNI